MPIRVTVWNEFRHEKKNPKVAEIYPNGMHEAIASHLRKSKDLEVRTATLDEPEHGLTERSSTNTDVLTWWGHLAPRRGGRRSSSSASTTRVLAGMGLRRPAQRALLEDLQAS